MKIVHFQTVCKIKSKGKTEVVIEDRTLRGGHLYIRRETKTGAAAEKEIKKRLPYLVKDIIKEIDESH